MKLKQLESLLGTLQQFSNPKYVLLLLQIDLEQYPTGPHIASRMLYTFSFGNHLGREFIWGCDQQGSGRLGCGCGTLGLAASLLDAEYVVGLDIDAQSIEIATANAEDLELEMDFVQCDLRNLGWRGPIVDTVVMNPPFGTRKKGADMDFLCAALKHVKRTALRDYNAKSAEVLCELRFDVPQLYKFHKKKEVDVAVDLWRFVPQRIQGKGL
ncbi:hypothetical protein C3L33_19430, partial [Rhododendron williamsianum]